MQIGIMDKVENTIQIGIIDKVEIGQKNIR
jgi:hypothetical protein